jgi:hypothetical protein
MQAVLAVFTVMFAALAIYDSKLTPQTLPPTEEYKAGLLSFLFFSYINGIIDAAARKDSLELEDVPGLVDADTCAFMHERMTKNDMKHRSLVRRLFEVTKSELWIQQLFQFISSSVLYLPPWALKSILAHVGSTAKNSQGEVLSARMHSSGLVMFGPYTAVAVLLIGPMVKSICDGQNWNRSRRVANRVRSSIVSLIYTKTLHVDLAAVAEGPGSLNNLISVDTREVSEFASDLHLLWCTPYEAAICLTLLILVLGPSALVGIGLMSISVPMWTFATHRMQGYQTKLLKDKVCACVR